MMANGRTDWKKKLEETMALARNLEREKNLILC